MTPFRHRSSLRHGRRLSTPLALSPEPLPVVQPTGYQRRRLTQASQQIQPGYALTTLVAGTSASGFRAFVLYQWQQRLDDEFEALKREQGPAGFA